MKERAKRDKVISKMMKMAIELHKKYSRELEDNIWSMSLDWNRKHEDCEIFMCELGDDDDNLIGFMIEDDPFYYKNMEGC